MEESPQSHTLTPLRAVNNCEVLVETFRLGASLAQVRAIFSGPHSYPQAAQNLWTTRAATVSTAVDNTVEQQVSVHHRGGRRCGLHSGMRWISPDSGRNEQTGDNVGRPTPGRSVAWRRRRTAAAFRASHLVGANPDPTTTRLPAADEAGGACGRLRPTLRTPPGGQKCR